jgi:hypothetical protein
MSTRSSIDFLTGLNNKIAEENQTLKERLTAMDGGLHTGGLGHTHGTMPDDPTRTEIEAQIAASEARASTRLAEALGEMRTGFADVRTGFAELRGEMREGFARTNERLDAVERSTGGIKTTVIGTGIAVVAIVIAVLAYGQTWFGIGISSRDVIRATVAEMRQAPSQPPR